MTTKEIGGPDERRLSGSLVWRSIWHWDLWTATVVGAAVAVFWALTDREPGWAWFGTVVVGSVILAGVAWSQWNSLFRLLLRSAYGELVRIADPTMTKVGLPYLVTRRVAFASAICAAATAIAIEVLDNKWVEAPLVGLTGLLAAWSILGVVSLSEHSSRHNKMRAEMEAMREESAAAERRHRRALEEEQ